MAGRFSGMARSLQAVTTFKIDWGARNAFQPHLYMGKISIKNTKELSAQQISKSNLIRKSFQIQVDLCRGIEDNLHKCERLMSHYDRDVASGALIEQFQLVVDDLNRYRLYFLQFVGAFGGLIFKAVNMLNSIKTKIKSGMDILQYFTDILDELMKWCDVSMDLMVNSSKQVLSVFKQDYLNQLHSEAAVINNIQTQIQQRIKSLRANIQTAKDAAQATTLMAAFIQDLKNWSGTINKCATVLSSLVLQPELDPKRASFRVSKEINEILGLIVQNHSYLANLVDRQRFYVETSEYVGIPRANLARVFSAPNSNILRYAQTIGNTR